MNFPDKSCRDFISELASSAPVPGGGGASALVGAVGAALGSMVASLTIGKKKYAQVEDELKALNEKCIGLQNRLLELIDEDARGFAPLAQAYSMPANTQEEKLLKEQVLETESVNACSVPLEIMQTCCEAIDAIEIFAEKGSVMALSDAGVGALFCKAALEGASLNVFINTKGLKDRSKAEELNAKANALLGHSKKAEEIFNKVAAALR
jgi:formiminotetrahydrofolate cyclodeaminase